MVILMSVYVIGNSRAADTGDVFLRLGELPLQQEQGKGSDHDQASLPFLPSHFDWFQERTPLVQHFARRLRRTPLVHDFARRLRRTPLVHDFARRLRRTPLVHDFARRLRRTSLPECLPKPESHAAPLAGINPHHREIELLRNLGRRRGGRGGIFSQTDGKDRRQSLNR